MAGGVNKAIIVGNLGADPELRYTPSGQAVATLRIATGETWNDKDGQKQERTEWHRVIVWGKQAELASQYLSKGRQVYIEGRLQTREWQDRDNNKRYTTEIVALQLVFLGGRGEQRSETREPGAPQTGSGNENNFDYGVPPMNTEDVPF